MNSRTIILTIILYSGVLILFSRFLKKNKIEEFTNVDDILKGTFKDLKTSKS